jgi:hypothetical protein
MTALSRNARIAGLLYLTLLTAPLRLIYIPSKLFVATHRMTSSSRRVSSAMARGLARTRVHCLESHGKREVFASLGVLTIAIHEVRGQSGQRLRARSNPEVARGAHCSGSSHVHRIWFCVHGRAIVG